MGLLDYLRPPKIEEGQFSTSISDIESFASWLRGESVGTPTVTPYTILGIASVLRSVSVISTTIAGLPLRTYEREADERVRIPSVFDDPYPGVDGQTPFEWVETVLIHLLLWREAFLWHEAMDTRSGLVTAYRPILPDAFEEVKRANGKRIFTYTDGETQEKKEVDSRQVTYIPGPSLDGVKGHPWLWAARNIFKGALAGDEAASKTLQQGIRIGALLTPADDAEDIDPSEGEQIIELLRPKVTGPNAAGDIAFINRRLKLDPWTANNVESQWHEIKSDIDKQVGQLFGMPSHLLNDTEKQTSWGTGVAEQNLGLARYTLMGWSSRIEQRLSLRLPFGPRVQFTEFDYKGLLQGTPAQEIELLIKQIDAGILLPGEARKILNLPPLPESAGAASAKEIAEVIQKIYLGVVNGVLSADEARSIANRLGADLSGPAPAPKPDPVPEIPA